MPSLGGPNLRCIVANKHNPQISAPGMIGRTGRNEVTTKFFYDWPLRCACSFSGCEWAYCHGTLLCEFSTPTCGGVLGGSDQNRAEEQNVVLTWFRPVTGSSGHLGRRKSTRALAKGQGRFGGCRLPRGKQKQ